MISVAIVGLGNIGSHLYRAFSQAQDVQVTQYNSRGTLEIKESFDLVIIAVSDAAITHVSSQISNALVVHTSGGTEISLLQNLGRKGVFYPLQTFTKGKEVDFTKIPICIEAENMEDLELLRKLGATISNTVIEIDSDQRKHIHVAAVFVNNFVNHMYVMANDICKEHEVPFEILMPLIQETAEKITQLSPREAQTGPAKRNDQKTIQKHLDLLNQYQQNIYSTITASIQQYGKKL